MGEPGSRREVASRNLYGFVEGDPEDKVDPKGDLSWRTTSGPRSLYLNGCGGWEWIIEWTFDSSERDGYVVQWVRAYWDHKDCDKAPVRKGVWAEHYEAWRVKNGRCYRDRAATIPTPCKDRFYQPQRQGKVPTLFKDMRCSGLAPFPPHSSTTFRRLGPFWPQRQNPLSLIQQLRGSSILTGIAAAVV